MLASIFKTDRKRMIMKKLSIYGLLLATVCMTASCANNGNNDSQDVANEANEQKFDNTKMEDDSKFAVDAANSGMTEVQLSQVALKNASSQDVKNFAQRMIEDHGKANEELKATAAQKNITLPVAPDEDKQKMIDDMSAKTGSDFDKDYMDQMVEDHNKAIDLFQDEADNGKDADLRMWANGKLPLLKEHLEMAKNIKDGLK